MELAREIEEVLLAWSAVKDAPRRLVIPGARENADEHCGLPNPCSRLIEQRNATYVLRRVHLNRLELTDVSPSITQVLPWSICLPHPLQDDGIATFVDTKGKFVQIFLLTVFNDQNFVHTLLLENGHLSYVSTASFKLGAVTSVVSAGPDTLVAVGDGRLWQLDLRRKTSKEILSQATLLDRLLGKTYQGIFVRAAHLHGYIAVVDRNGGIILWNVASGKQVGKLELGCAEIVLAPSRVGPPLLAVASSTFLHIYDIPELRPLKRIVLENTPIADVQWGSHTQVLLQLFADDGSLPRIIRIDVEERVLRPRFVASPISQEWEESEVEVVHFDSFLAGQCDYGAEEEIATQWWVDRICRRHRFPPNIIHQAVGNLENILQLESIGKRPKLDTQPLCGIVRGFLVRKGAALEKWDLGQVLPSDKTSVIHAVCTGAKDLLKECLRLQSAADVTHQTWAFSEQWDTFLGVTPLSLSLLRRVTWWEQGASTLNMTKLANLPTPLQSILDASDNPMWPLIVGSWLFTRSCMAPWLTVCSSLLGKTTASVEAVSSVTFDINPEVDAQVKECVQQISTQTLDELFKGINDDAYDLELTATNNADVSLRDVFHSSQLVTALEAKVAFLLHIYALLENYDTNEPSEQLAKVKQNIRKRLPRMAICAAGYALPHVGALPDMCLGDSLACNTVSYAQLDSIEFAHRLAGKDAWTLLDVWCEGRPGLRAYFRGFRFLKEKRFPEAVEAFHNADEGCYQALPVQEGWFTIECPFEVLTKVSYFIHVSSLLELHSAHNDTFVFLTTAWDQWTVWATLADKQDVDFQMLLWQKAFSVACNNCLWDEAITAMFRLPNESARRWALRELGAGLRVHGESGRVLSWDLPESLFRSYIEDLQHQAYSFVPLVGSTSLHCYNILYATFISREEYDKAAQVMYKMYLSLLEHTKQMSIQNYVLAPKSPRVVGDSISDPTQIPPPATALPGTASNAAPRVTAEDTSDLLKVQRDALVLCAQALELMENPTFVLGLKDEIVDEDAVMEVGGRGTSMLVRMKAALRKAKRRASCLVVTPEIVKLCILWAEAKIIIQGQPAQTPSEVVQLLCCLGLVNLGLALAEALKEDTWTFVVRPFLMLCITADGNPAGVAALADAARGPLLSSMFIRHDGCEPMGLAAKEGDIAAIMWHTLQEVAIRTNTVVDVANELLTERPGVPLPWFVLKELNGDPHNMRWVTLLRLYMKHHMPDECVRLVETQLTRIMSYNEGCISSGRTYCPATLCRQLRTALQHNQELCAVDRLDSICREFSQVFAH